MQKKILILILSSILISSCAKKIEEIPNDVNQSSSQESAQITEVTNKQEETPPQPNTTPVTEQKPETILNATTNPVEKSRQMVRQATIEFSAKDVVKTALAIEKLTLESGGFLEQKNIDFSVTDTKFHAIADGKIKIFEKISPQAIMIVRIPSDRTAYFINQLLPFMNFLNQQQYSAKRYELKLLEEKIAQAQSVPSNLPKAQNNEISRLTQLEVQDRIHFSTIAITFNQPTLIREKIDLDLDAIAQANQDSFWQRAWYGIQKGWQFILDFLVILITIWPVYLFAILVFILYIFFKSFLRKFIK